MEEEPLNLKRYNGETDLEHSKELEYAREKIQNASEARFFDSRRYRCCFKTVHAKIGTFVFCTLVFHEIMLGTIYLVNLFYPQFPDCPIYAYMAFVARIVQILCSGTLYLSLYLHDPKYLLPFAVAQPTCGTFADLTTLYVLIDNLSRSKSKLLLFKDEVANLLMLATVYVIIVIALMWLLRRCYRYLKARQAHEAQRRKEKEELAAAKALVAAANGKESYI
ncbi:hypothetical protein QR680_002665 [Steinernema hermaphroditum]|uniref:Uncharacterized protein n=1 Tax=Steinernema hermaphroditum TaxID=289476 RepID=A0AA39LIS9_9BILA|nr:hypothetical protein QR680_002665 [Steinernema hermaphroditum]